MMLLATPLRYTSSATPRPRRGRVAHRPIALFGFGKKKENKEDRPATVAELAARNSKKFGFKSSSKGTYGFASKPKSYIEVEGDYLDDGWVEQPSREKKPGFFAKILGKKPPPPPPPPEPKGLARFFGKKK